MPSRRFPKEAGGAALGCVMPVIDAAPLRWWSPFLYSRCMPVVGQTLQQRKLVYYRIVTDTSRDPFQP